MTIYQLHHKYGEYEDYRNIIIGTYLYRATAEADMKVKIVKSEEANKCNNCAVTHCPDDCKIAVCNSEACDKFRASAAKAYCSEYAGDEDGYCKNMKVSFFDDEKFYIEEVEVDEKII